MKPFISLENLTIGFSEHLPLVKNLNISIDKPELIALLGINGIGKSSFLKTIAGLQNKLSGKILLLDKNSESIKTNEIAKNLIYVPTGINVLFNLNVFDYVALGRIPFLKWNAKLEMHDKEIIYQSLKLVKAEHLVNRNVLNLSDGEKQKILLAKALAQQTKLILLDEPTAFLDIENKIEIIYLLRQLVNKEQRFIIFSTHDWDLAMQFADKLLIFNNQQYEFGTPEDLISQHKFDNIFPKEYVHFDYNDLHFKPNTQITNAIKILNFSSKKKHKLTLNALRRASLNYDCNFSIKETVIEIHDSFWLIISNEKSTKAKNFEELLLNLKNT